MGEQNNNSLNIEVSSDNVMFFEKPVEIQMGSKEISDIKDFQAALSEKRIGVIETDSNGSVIDVNVPFQIDIVQDENCCKETEYLLIFIMKGETVSDITRYYKLILTTSENPELDFKGIEISDNIIYKGQESRKIVTENVTYYYHMKGGAFASIIDSDGNDWISFQETGGSAGHYRGIPNVVHPEEGFHPGVKTCISSIKSSGPLKVTIDSETEDKKWACTWEIYPLYAKLTVKKIGHPYWFLYEGTPGGRIMPEKDFSVTSDGNKRVASEEWIEKISNWIYFGDGESNRILYLIRHENHDVLDSCRTMEGNMTVFGYGRTQLSKHMTLIPAHFTIGFYDNNKFEDASKIIDSAYKNYSIKLD